MGEIIGPEDVLSKKPRRVPDLGPRTIPKPAAPYNLEGLVREVRELRAEVERIKKALKSKSISV